MIWDKSREYAYYYQVQSQINTCEQASYADFIVWSESNIYIERILPDKVFWNGLVEKAITFFKTCLLMNWQENFTADLPALFRTVYVGALTIKRVLPVIKPLLILVIKVQVQ